MPRKDSAEMELRWREILDRQGNSGLSVRRFCASEGISEPSFYAWRKKFRRRVKDGERRTDEPDQSRLFVPLTLLDASATLEIIHPGGCRIQVTGEVNPAALRTAIEVLDERVSR
jgi:transposase-like protein